MKLKDIFKIAVGGAIAFGASKLIPGIGGKIGGALASSLMNKTGAGGDYEIQSTAVQAPNFGGRIGRERSDEAGRTSNIKTANAADLNYMWERRLMNAMGKDAEYKRTLT